MKNLILAAFLFCLHQQSIAQSISRSNWLNDLERGDTLYMNFCIAHGEFGSSHQGILLYSISSAIYAKYVIYRYGVLLKNGVIMAEPNVSGVPLHKDSIVSFYKKINREYNVSKEDWRLNSSEIASVEEYIHDLEARDSIEGSSNAPDFYSLLWEQKSVVVIDRRGTWNRFVRIKNDLKIPPE